MKVKVAKTAGFCFGVQRAVNQVYSEVENGKKPIYTYGPIIHNEEVVADLERKGVSVIETKEELARLTSGTVIIRSHGIGKDVYDLIERQGVTLVDATCPFVRKIHRIVQEHSHAGEQIVIIGNAKHPEVEGICGWCETRPVVIETVEEAEAFPMCQRSSENPQNEGSTAACPTTLCIVSQTTFNYNKFQNLVEIIEKKGYDKNVINTICSATEERQTEAAEISRETDTMIVIGGRHSSNTQKLFDICRSNCKNTYYIQTLDDLEQYSFPPVGCVGITAGASTPKHLIKEVQEYVRDEL
ncbi:MAG: 4-hydroxy-3-methylbut-2-enyl diphosphate reductase [Eubacteriales bacterium]|nr:4-hydroxy-3-methylbut-2-enyl diphosphate reductase [Eubacteriales bacterium]